MKPPICPNVYWTTDYGGPLFYHREQRSTLHEDYYFCFFYFCVKLLTNSKLSDDLYMMHLNRKLYIDILKLYTYCSIKQFNVVHQMLFRRANAPCVSHSMSRPIRRSSSRIWLNEKSGFSLINRDPWAAKPAHLSETFYEVNLYQKPQIFPTEWYNGYHSPGNDLF